MQGSLLLADSHPPMLAGVRSLLEGLFEVVVMVAEPLVTATPWATWFGLASMQRFGLIGMTVATDTLLSSWISSLPPVLADQPNLTVGTVAMRAGSGTVSARALLR